MKLYPHILYVSTAPLSNFHAHICHSVEMAKDLPSASTDIWKLQKFEKVATLLPRNS